MEEHKNGEHINFLHQPQQPTHTPDLQPPNKTARKVVAFFFIVALLFAGCKVVFPANDITDNPLDYDPVTLEPKKPKSLLKKISYFVFNRTDAPLAGEGDDRINVLLLGMGGLGHDGPYLSDTIIIASIKPSTNQVALISIPRDLGVNIPGYGIRKINHANAYGENEKEGWGAAFATEVIEKTFDIEIPYYIRLDFKAFEEIIDDVGGVKVDVERSFTDPLYPAANNLYQTVTFKAGVQNMEGKTALKYARSRHGNNGEGSDFARARRQQKILLALKEKLLSFGTLANPVRINNVITSLEEHLTTNLEFSEIVSFIKLARELENTQIRTIVLDNSPENYLQNAFSSQGAFILEPKSGNYNEINLAIKQIFDQEFEQATTVGSTPEQDKPVLPAATIEIQNGTWQAGVAARLKKKLM
ncbi:MAG: hypothetical protein COU33_04915, partial [Candidatus Magasanikbacteria bacterium CG10_big_fil_rev_8_21_14_0_10_43_6]